MNTDYIIFPILMILVIAGACLLAALLLLGMGTLFYRFIRRKNQVFQAADQALEADTGAYLSNAAAQILPWEPEALQDFSSHLAITGRRVLSSLHYRGALKSLSRSVTAGWLAFDLQLKFGKGPMELRTQKCNYQLDIKTTSAHVRVDGIPLGQMRASGREITLLGVDQRPPGVININAQTWDCGYP